MTHWSDKYIGRAYVVATYDCATLAQEIAQQEFNCLAPLPFEHGKNSLGQQRQLLRYKMRLADPIALNAVQEGDLVLMITCGRLNHIGVYYQVEGVAWVIHNTPQAGGVIRTRLRSLAQIGYQLEGFYRWKQDPL